MASETIQYPRPPITEAVIELRFEDMVGHRELERLRDRFKSQFGTVEELQTIEVSIEGTKVNQKSEPAGFKMTARNAVDVLMINPNSIATVRFAPYENWETFVGRAKENFETFTKVAGRHKIKRIGTRFLNRIDVPNSIIQGQDLTEFLRIGVSFDNKIAKVVQGFSVVLNAIHNETGAKLTIQSAITPPALLEHTSITLDIDAYWDTDIPLRIDEIWAKTDILRTAKNAVFEISITDRVRELFK
jgi:uncharacterized protein (TIGR04255 family)